MTDPVYGVSAALFDHKNVLLIRRRFPPFQDHWTLPGGRLEPGEDAETAIHREIWEETGLRDLDLKPVEIYDVKGYALQVFAGRALIAQATAHSDAADVRLVSLQSPPALTYTPALWSIIATARQVIKTRQWGPKDFENLQ